MMFNFRIFPMVLWLVTSLSSTAHASEPAIDGGSTARMLTSVALVLLMKPGLGSGFHSEHGYGMLNSN